MKSKDSFRCVGKILSPFGVRGSLRFKSFTSPKENILSFPNLLIEEDDSFINLTVCEFRHYKSIFLVDFHDIVDRSAASLYTNKFVFIKKEALPFLPKGEFYCENMLDFHLSSTVNAILCLFGAIGYLDPNQERRQGLINFYDHIIIFFN